MWVSKPGPPKTTQFLPPYSGRDLRITVSKKPQSPGRGSLFWECHCAYLAPGARFELSSGYPTGSHGIPMSIRQRHAAPWFGGNDSPSKAMGLPCGRASDLASWRWMLRCGGKGLLHCAKFCEASAIRVKTATGEIDWLDYPRILTGTIWYTLPNPRL